MDDSTTKACDIDIRKFLPMQSDVQEIKSRMQMIVSRIITEQMPFFNQFKEHVQKHIRHAYWRESAKRSVVVSAL